MRVLKVGLVLLLWVLALTAQAELKFPQLTGRLVMTLAAKTLASRHFQHGITD